VGGSQVHQQLGIIVECCVAMETLLCGQDLSKLTGEEKINNLIIIN
jgi:hypothetical protein